jgi:CHAT domain-containing protein
LLHDVLPKGSAARARLRAGDVLLRWGEHKLDSAAELKKAIAPGRVRVRVWRDGKEFDAVLEGTALGIRVDSRPAAEAIRDQRQFDALTARRGTGHKRLPGTLMEVKALARLVPCATVLLGSQASEQQLDTLNEDEGLKRYRLLHFATHGEPLADDPERSALILAQDRLPDPLEQVRQGKKVYTGRLTVRTMRQQWKLDADLVVLSACQTALGQDAGGEGLLGFAQVLLGKGARSVVLSRWQVDDRATALLMARFYENLLGQRKELKKALPRARALAEAKRWLRELTRKEAQRLTAELVGALPNGTGTPRGKVVPLKAVAKKAAKLPGGDRPFEHPFYWAAFVLVGDPD